MATIKEVAKKANVSIATVSRVLNKSGKYSKETKDRVLEAAKSLNYTINIGARGLKTGKTQLIAISIPEYYLLQYPEILANMIPYLSSNGFHIDLLINTKLINLHKYIKEGRYDGVIIINPEQDDKAIHNIVEENIPCIFAYKEMDREDVNTISIDFFQAGYVGTKHLIKAGHKNIIFVGRNESSFASKEIERGYLFAHDEYGIQYKEENILRFSHKDALDSYRTPFEELIKNNNPSTAILTMDHYNTYIILKLINDMGLKIPLDISVVACGEINKLIYTLPELTMVTLPIEQTARLSSEILLNAILNNDRVVKRVKLMVQMMEGKSVLKRLTKRQ